MPRPLKGSRFWTSQTFGTVLLSLALTAIPCHVAPPGSASAVEASARSTSAVNGARTKHRERTLPKLNAPARPEPPPPAHPQGQAPERSRPWRPNAAFALLLLRTVATLTSTNFQSAIESHLLVQSSTVPDHVHVVCYACGIEYIYQTRTDTGHKPYAGVTPRIGQ